MDIFIHGVVEAGYKNWSYPVPNIGEKVVLNNVMYKVREVVHNYDTEVIHIYLQTI